MAVYIYGGGMISSSDIRQDMDVSVAVSLTDCAHTCASLRSNWSYLRTDQKVLRAVHISMYTHIHIYMCIR